MSDTKPPNVLELILTKVAEHVRANNGERPTHVMLPKAEAAAVRKWMYANPSAVQDTPHTSHVAGLVMIQGDEFKVWRASDREYVIGMEPHAMCAKFGNGYYVTAPDRKDGRLRRLTRVRDSEDEAWAAAAETLRKREHLASTARDGRTTMPEDRAEDSVPSVSIVGHYVAGKHKGASFAINDHRAPVIYALPFIFPLAGRDRLFVPDAAAMGTGFGDAAGNVLQVNITPNDTAEPVFVPRPPAAPVVVHSTMTPTFACPLCRMSSDLARGADMMASVLMDAPNWSWKFRLAADFRDADEANLTLAVAVSQAIEHMAKHGVAAEWHTVDVMEEFPGTAYGAVVLRGLGPMQQPSASTRITATAVEITARDGVPFELLFLAERVPGVRGQRGILCELELVCDRAPVVKNGTRITVHEARFDAPLTIDTVAMAFRDQIAALPECEQIPDCVACNAPYAQCLAQRVGGLNKNGPACCSDCSHPTGYPMPPAVQL